MHALRHITFALALILCLGAFLSVASSQNDEGLDSRDLSGRIDSHRPEASGSAPRITIDTADLPAADRRESDAGRLALPRLSQLPLLSWGADAERGTGVGDRRRSSGAPPHDDRLLFSPSLVIQHVRLQV